jgi:hypothetical protein
MKVAIKYIVTGVILGLWKCNCPNCRDGGQHLVGPKSVRFIDLCAVNADDALRHAEQFNLAVNFPDCSGVRWVQGPEIEEVKRE